MAIDNIRYNLLAMMAIGSIGLRSDYSFIKHDQNCLSIELNIVIPFSCDSLLYLA